MAKLRIGLNSSSLADMPNPVGGDGLDVNYSINRIVKRALNGEKNVTYLGSSKENITLNFVNKSKADFDLLFGFANVAMEYWVQIINDAGVKYFEGWATLYLQNPRKKANSDSFTHEFSLVIEQS